MAFDYSKLSGKVVEVFGTNANFAREMGLSERSVSLKFNNRVPWKQAEIVRAAGLLGIDISEIQAYFFTEKVQSA